MLHTLTELRCCEAYLRSTAGERKRRFASGPALGNEHIRDESGRDRVDAKHVAAGPGHAGAASGPT